MGLTGLGEDWPLLEEVLDLAAGRLCHGPRRRVCRTENGVFSEWACQECREFRQPETISPWTWHLVLLYQLKEAGYPFRANDLTLETWILLGLVGKAFRAAQREVIRRSPSSRFGREKEL